MQPAFISTRLSFHRDAFALSSSTRAENLPGADGSLDLIHCDAHARKFRTNSSHQPLLLNNRKPLQA
jgi:hypothetical protein